MEQRSLLSREHQMVDGAYGSIRIKVGASGGAFQNAAPEYEDCRKVAEEHGIPIKEVMQDALARWRNASTRALPERGALVESYEA